jgi:hypothetical protein
MPVLLRETLLLFLAPDLAVKGILFRFLVFYVKLKLVSLLGNSICPVEFAEAEKSNFVIGQRSA